MPGDQALRERPETGVIIAEFAHPESPQNASRLVLMDLESGTVFRVNAQFSVLVERAGETMTVPADTPFTREALAASARPTELRTWVGNAMSFPGLAVEQVREAASETITRTALDDGGVRYVIEVPGANQITVEFDAEGVPVRIDQWQGESHADWTHLPRPMWPLVGEGRDVVTRLEYVENASADDFAFLERTATKFRNDFQQTFFGNEFVSLENDAAAPVENNSGQSNTLWIALLIVGLIVCGLAIVAIFKRR